MVSTSSGRMVRRIDHLGLDALSRELVRRLQRPLHHQREGHDGDVIAGAQHLRLADRQDEIVEGQAPRSSGRRGSRSPGRRRGVGIADRRFQQPLGVGGAVGRDHLEARAMGVPGRIFLAVLRGDACRSAVRTSENDGENRAPRLPYRGSWRRS